MSELTNRLSRHRDTRSTTSNNAVPIPAPLPATTFGLQYSHPNLDVLNRAFFSLLHPTSCTGQMNYHHQAATYGQTGNSAVDRSNFIGDADRVPAPSSFLHRYLRMLQHRDNAKKEQASQGEESTVNMDKQPMALPKQPLSTQSVKLAGKGTSDSPPTPKADHLQPQHALELDSGDRQHVSLLGEQLKEYHGIDSVKAASVVQVVNDGSQPNVLWAHGDTVNDSDAIRHKQDPHLTIVTSPVSMEMTTSLGSIDNLSSPCLTQASTLSTISSSFCNDLTMSGRDVDEPIQPIPVRQTQPLSHCSHQTHGHYKQQQHRLFPSQQPLNLQSPRSTNNQEPLSVPELHEFRPKSRTMLHHPRRTSLQPRTVPLRSMSSVVTSSPRVTRSSYDRLPSSSAVSFLSMFSDRTSGVTEEETEMLREDEAGDEIGGYVLGRALARGYFSTVHEAYHVEETKVKVGPVAVKIVRRGNTNAHSLRRRLSAISIPEDDNQSSTSCYSDEPDGTDDAEEAIRRELLIWRRLRHPNVIPLLDTFESPISIYAVSPRCTQGNLLNLLNRTRGCADGAGGVALDMVHRIAAQLVSAVRYLHWDAAVVHGDLKLENVLLNADNTVMLCDFGLSRELFDEDEQQRNRNSDVSDGGDGMSSSVDESSRFVCKAAGSMPYLSPELIRSSVPERSSDCWALGVILYACLVGHLPFMDSYEPRLIYKILNGQYELPLGDDEEEEEEEEKGGFFSNDDYDAEDWGFSLGDGHTDDKAKEDDTKMKQPRPPAGCLALIRGLLQVKSTDRWCTRRATNHDWIRDVANV